MRAISVVISTAAAALLLVSCSSSGGGQSGAAGSSTAASTPPATTAASTAAATAAGQGPAYSKPGAPAAAAGKAITISNFAYAGGLTVKAGATVTVINNDPAPHTVTDKVHKLFDSGNIAANGGKGTFTAPTKPGTYDFGCTYHSAMKGTLTVTS